MSLALLERAIILGDVFQNSKRNTSPPPPPGNVVMLVFLCTVLVILVAINIAWGWVGGGGGGGGGRGVEGFQKFAMTAPPGLWQLIIDIHHHHLSRTQMYTANAIFEFFPENIGQDYSSHYI